MSIEVLSLDQISNVYGATTAAEYAMRVLKRSKQAREANGKESTINVSITDEHGFEVYHTIDGEMMVQDGEKWVGIICGGVSSGKVGEWLLVRGSPPPERPRFVLNPARIAEIELAFTRMRSAKRSADEDPAPAVKRQAVGVHSLAASVNTIRQNMVGQGTSMQFEDKTPLMVGKGTQTAIPLSQLREMRNHRTPTAPASSADPATNGTVAKHKLGLSLIFSAAAKAPIEISRPTYSKSQLLCDANILTQKISRGLADLRGLNNEIERRRKGIQHLWRAGAQERSMTVKTCVDKLGKWIAERDRQLLQVQTWVDEKQNLDRKVAEFVR